MPYDEKLARRIRDVLKRRRGITEKKMFGGIAFMVNEEVVWEAEAGSVATDGVFGLRVNHGLNLHITSITTAAAG